MRCNIVSMNSRDASGEPNRQRNIVCQRIGHPCIACPSSISRNDNDGRSANGFGCATKCGAGGRRDPGHSLRRRPGPICFHPSRWATSTRPRMRCAPTCRVSRSAFPAARPSCDFTALRTSTRYHDFNARNQTDAPAPQSIPLANSAAAMQGGDFGMSSRFSPIRYRYPNTNRLGHSRNPRGRRFRRRCASLHQRGVPPSSSLGRGRYGAVPRAGWASEQLVERGRVRNGQLRDQSQPVLRASGAGPRHRIAGAGIDRPSLARNAGYAVHLGGRRFYPDASARSVVSALRSTHCPTCWAG